MDFSFSEDQKAFRRVVTRFGEQERVRKRVAEADIEGKIPWDLVRELGELGLLGLNIPERFGGTPASAVTMGAVLEEFGRIDLTLSDIVMNHLLMGGELLAKHGKEEVQEEWLPKICSGETTIAISLTEPRGGSDAAHLTCAVEERHDDYVVLDGAKNSVSALSGGVVIVFAREKGSVGAGGVSAFVVPTESEGIKRRYYQDLGARGLQRGDLFLDRVRLPTTHQLGETGRAFSKVMEGFDMTRVLISLFCLGAAQQSVDETIEYVKMRKAFGMPIARYQAVSHPLVDAIGTIDALRWFCYHVLWLREQGQKHAGLAGLVKAQVPKKAARIIQECLTLNGHYAYTNELPIERRLRDVIGFQLGDGTEQIGRDVAVREFIGREHLSRW